MNDKMMTAKEWQEKEFLPWKNAMAEYAKGKAEQAEKLRAHAHELQAMVAMLLEGKTRQAMLAWNALELHPKLREMRLSDGGEVLSMITSDGRVEVLKVDEVVAGLAALLAGTGRE